MNSISKLCIRTCRYYVAPTDKPLKASIGQDLLSGGIK